MICQRDYKAFHYGASMASKAEKHMKRSIYHRGSDQHFESESINAVARAGSQSYSFDLRLDWRHSISLVCIPVVGSIILHVLRLLVWVCDR